MLSHKKYSGILCPIFSLTSNEGIGTFGQGAFEFIDFLDETNQRYWQVLPMGTTSYGDSPYQSFSSYAGNPYFIDLELLKKDGLLHHEDIDIDWGNSEYINYSLLWNTKYEILRKAFENSLFTEEDENDAYLKFPWLKDYALFMSLKTHYHGNSRSEWIDGKFKKNLSNDLLDSLKKESLFHVFMQLKFYEQWFELKKYANSKGVLIIGDIPIFVSSDSVDVWSYPEYFLLDDQGKPTVVAGVPPDYFSEYGQLWGNPLYNWDRIKEDHFNWWMDRIEISLRLFDILRIDHFRAFESYWAISYGEQTAINGQWKKTPGREFFHALKKKFGQLPIIAEDLGVITAEVESLMNYTEFPGMCVLQFAFDDNPKNPYKPYNITTNKVIYTGTHDNDTTIGWYLDPNNKDQVNNAIKYIGKDVISLELFVYEFIKLAFQSHANTAIIPIQDILGLGKESRINIPSTLGNNWTWRMANMPNKYQKNTLSELTIASLRSK